MTISKKQRILCLRLQPLRRDEEQPAPDRLQLCRELEEFSSLIGWCEWDGAWCFCLDVAGTSHWFGGERLLVEQLSHWCAERGWAALCAITDTLAASWGVAMFGRDEVRRSFVARIVPGEQTMSALCSLPIEALRLSKSTLALLHELGLDRCGSLFEIPREALAERFEPELMLRPAQARGEIDELFTPYRPPPHWEAEQTWENGVASLEILHAVWQRLLSKLLIPPASQGHGIVRLLVELIGESRSRRRLVLGLMCPSLDRKHLLELLLLRMESVRLQEPIIGTKLSVLESTPVAWQQQMLFTELSPPVESPQWALLVERLTGRLSSDRVVRIRPRADHQPERAWKAEPWIDRNRPHTRSRPSSHERKFLPRPTLLLPQPRSIQVFALAPEGHPQQFRDRGRELRIVRSWGPERIETGWWRGPSLRRDYFRVETDAGVQAWLFRDLWTHGWYLHGWFD